jgi:hypothetical protein
MASLSQIININKYFFGSNNGLDKAKEVSTYLVHKGNLIEMPDNGLLKISIHGSAIDGNYIDDTVKCGDIIRPPEHDPCESNDDTLGNIQQTFQKNTEFGIGHYCEISSNEDFEFCFSVSQVGISGSSNIEFPINLILTGGCYQFENGRFSCIVEGSGISKINCSGNAL